MARCLGWFSIALGVVELAAPRAVTRWLGIEGRENLLRTFGAREISAGIVSLSTEKQMGMWSRVAGDGMDLAALLAAYQSGNPKRARSEERRVGKEGRSRWSACHEKIR